MLGALLILVSPVPPTLEERYADQRPVLADLKLKTWPKLYRDNDAAGLDAFLDPAFVAMSADGAVETKAQAVAWLRSNEWENATRNFRYDITAIDFIEAGVANVYGVGSYDGSTCRMRYTSANIFVQKVNGWHPRFSHTSKAECEEKR